MFDHTTAGAQLLLTSAAAAVVVLAVLSLYLLFTNKLRSRSPPGPRGLPLLGNLLSLDPELHTYFASLAETYGPIFRLRLGTKTAIVISTPAVAKEVLKDHDATFANRDVPAAALEAAYGGADIAWTPYGPEWRMLRKVCVREMLSPRNLDSVYAFRRREVRQAVRDLLSAAGSPVNVGQMAFRAVMNVVTSMLWGDTLKEDDGAAAVGTEFKEVVGGMTALLGAPNISDFFPALAKFDLQGVQKKTRGFAQRFDRIFDSMIGKRLKIDGESDLRRGEESQDFLQFLMRMTGDSDSKPPFTVTHLKALLMDMVVGGTETTSNTLEFTLAEIINNPTVLKKVQQELDMVVGLDNIVEEDHITKLPYLHAVMKEVLRLHPALPLLIPHCPSKTCSVAGYTVPQGARIFVNVWAIHRDLSLWEKPNEFIPERFLNNEKWDFSGNDFNYFPFGSGRRICAGILMAERMFMYSLATLVHSFEWSLPLGHKMDLLEKFGIVLKKRVPLVAVPTPRLSNPSLYD